MTALSDVMPAFPAPVEPISGRQAQDNLCERMRTMHLKMVDAVLSGEGVCRVAELAAIAVKGRVAIVVPRLGAACLAPADEAGDGEVPVSAELERYVMDRLDGRLTSTPKGVVAEVPVLFRDEMVGAVFLLDDNGFDEAVVIEFLHVAAVASLTDVAVRNANSGVVQNLHGTVVEELRARSERESREFVRRASRLDRDLSRGGVALCMEPTADRPGHVMATILDENPSALTQRMSGTPSRGTQRIVALIPADHDEADPEEMRAAANRLAQRLERYGRVGVSSFHHDPSQLARAIHEAELTVEVLCQLADPRPKFHNVSSASFRMLFRMLASHPQELHSFYEDTVAPIARYDKEHRTELIKTLETYLDHNCNMNATAAALFAHRHTIAYRLERMYQLTQLDPAQFDDREQLGLGLKAYRLMGTVAEVS